MKWADTIEVKADFKSAGSLSVYVVDISYNMGTCALPDMYALRLLVYILGKALMPML